ncbi:c-type cytochrome [bacterium]|nr:c-type cytochrome [bacterium]
MSMMQASAKRKLKTFARLGVLSASVAAVLSGCALFKAAQRPPESVTVAKTPERVARGEYLATTVMSCVGCHSPLSESHGLVPGKEWSGGRLFGKADGLPGNIYSTNLSSDPETGLGSWTDGEILRAMREGVSKDGTALFPLMPYPGYHQMSDEDAHSIVAYLRTLPALKASHPKRELDFPLSLIVNTIPKPLEKPVAPPAADPVSRGKYLATMASCTDCHTPMEKGQPVMEKYFSGGNKFTEHGHTVVVSNITQDKTTGIGAWTDAQIERAIRFGQRPDGRMLSPIMPWMAYNRMSNDDMKALIQYLRTVPAVSSEKPKTTAHS